MARRTLSDEEKRQWDEIKRLAKPLPATEIETPEAAPPAKITVKNTGRFAPAIKPVSPQTPPLKQSGYAGVDRNTAERFRKGKFTIDATLDLHGHSREKAHGALSDFIHAHYARGSRCLLVITGKGAAKNSIGVLRAQLPDWLADPSLRPMVLAFDTAQGQHGGAGAYYILLRRKR